MCNPNSQDIDNDMHLLAMECALAWLKVGQLPLEATGQIYSHLLAAAAYYAPSRYNIYICTYTYMIIINKI